MNENYFVVEYRLPIRIDKAVNPKEAARKAQANLERETGLSLSNWYCRVFEYLPGEVNPIEYFGNPSGSELIRVDKNWNKHEKLTGEEENGNAKSGE